MVDILTEIQIARPLDIVAEYAANPDNAPEWYVNIKSAEWNYTSGMDHVHEPLLVIHGELDTLGSESQISWTSALPNASLITVPEAGFERNWKKVRSNSCHMTS